MVLRFEKLAESHFTDVLRIEAAVNTAPWSERAFRNELTNPESCFLVSIADGVVRGYGGYWRCIDEAHITNVAVDPEVHRQGIGRRLMNELLARAKEDGMTCSTLEVRAGNEAAIKLYESLGYKIVSRRKRYYPDNQEDALVMWCYDLV